MASQFLKLDFGFSTNELTNQFYFRLYENINLSSFMKLKSIFEI